MPLSLMDVGSKFRIRTVGGSASVRRHLGDMGFVEGTEVVVVAEAGGSLIVGVHTSRVALSRDLAGKIFV
ncbi:MAG: ferrous iron transport protein A [Kiritimatiellia bacterium]